jgi:hypothetical protein
VNFYEQISLKMNIHDLAISLSVYSFVFELLDSNNNENVCEILKKGNQ